MRSLWFRVMISGLRDMFGSHIVWTVPAWNVHSRHFGHWQTSCFPHGNKVVAYGNLRFHQKSVPLVTVRGTLFYERIRKNDSFQNGSEGRFLTIHGNLTAEEKPMPP